MKFGEFVKELRMKRGYTLRAFCREHNLDHGNHSKLERGIFAPPQDENALKTLAYALRISEGSEDWDKFFDLAIVGNGKIPDYIMKDEEVLSRLPLFFRTIDGEKIDKEKLDKLIELIRKS
ncbi:MAG: transcriptional regulator [Calditrichia bacterium]|jgi:transcriptional regulator with XRE-family HTH domain|nr:transcriptional regulator [Calditrichia bacterium]